MAAVHVVHVDVDRAMVVSQVKEYIAMLVVVVEEAKPPPLRRGNRDGGGHVFVSPLLSVGGEEGLASVTLQEQKK